MSDGVNYVNENIEGPASFKRWQTTGYISVYVLGVSFVALFGGISFTFVSREYYMYSPNCRNLSRNEILVGSEETWWW